MLTRKIFAQSNALPPDKRKLVRSPARAAGSFVPKLAAKVFEKYGFHSAEIMTEWARVAGADLAAFTAPERIKWPRGHAGRESRDTGIRDGATLVLRVEPARALDVQYRAGEILDRINRYFGHRAVWEIKIIQAPLQKGLNEAPQYARPLKVVPRPATGPVSEPDLRQALDHLWSSVARERGKH